MVMGKKERYLCLQRRGKSKKSISDIFLRALDVEFIEEKIKLTDLFLKSA